MMSCEFRFICFLSILAVVLSCACAPLASCVYYANHTWGCVCPYYGDGYASCEEYRFVTKATVRSKQDIMPWVGHVGGVVRSVTQRQLMNSVQYVIELDSTNYEAMTQLTSSINARNWPFEVALLGSATSSIITNAMYEEEPPLLEIVHVDYNQSWWSLKFVHTSGLIFVASEIVPLPCIHLQAECCITDYMYYPFHVGQKDASHIAQCVQTVSNESQHLGKNFSLLSHYILEEDATFLLRIHESELSRIATANADEANFSVGLMNGTSATQIHISLHKSRLVTNHTVGMFTRQVTSYIMMQVEQVGTTQWLHAWAEVSLRFSSVVFVQYAWGDMNWIYPVCEAVRDCISILTPCQGSVVDGVLDLWVPLQNHSTDKGNVTLYFVLQDGMSLARVMTQSAPQIITKHCVTSIYVPDQAEIQILQGLTMREIYRGMVLPYFNLNVEPQTDTLLTFVARSLDRMVIKDLQAVHTRTKEDELSMKTNNTCSSCIVEQLILNEYVVSPRSCHVFGIGDATTWIENYVGLVGSKLAFDVLNKVPSDVKSGIASAAWINPVWPWPNSSVTEELTFLRATVGYPTAGTEGGPQRRLLAINKSIVRARCNWLCVFVAAMLIMVWHLYVARNGYKIIA